MSAYFANGSLSDSWPRNDEKSATRSVRLASVSMMMAASVLRLSTLVVLMLGSWLDHRAAGDGS